MGRIDVIGTATMMGISTEVLTKIRDFADATGLHEETKIESLGCENSLREPIEHRFGTIIMNKDWEAVETIGDIIKIVCHIMEKEGRLDE